MTALVTALARDNRVIPTYVNNSPVRGVEPIPDMRTDQGSFMIEYTDSAPQTPDNGLILDISDGSTSNRVYVQKRTSSSRFRIASVASGQTGEVGDPFLGAFPSTQTNFKMLACWNSNTLRIWINGIQVAEILNFVHVDFDEINILQGNNNGNASSVTATKVTYYDRFLSDYDACRVTADVQMRDGITIDTTKRGYVGLGQSNSSSRASGTPTYSNSSAMYLVTNALALDSYSDAWDDDTNSVMTALDDSNAGSASAMGYFCDELAGMSGDDIAVIPANLGATGFFSATPTWHPNSATVRTSGTKITCINTSALAAYFQIKMASQLVPIEGVLQQLGESDTVSSTSTSDFQDANSLLIDSYRKGLQIEDKPWLLMGMTDFTGWATESDWDDIIDAQKNIANTKRAVYFLENSDVAGASGDEVHLDITGCERVGKKAARMLSSVGQSLSTFSSSDGTERAIDASGGEYLSNTGGFLWAQMTVNNIPTSNEYPLVLDDGSTDNVAGLRLFSGVEYYGYWLRGKDGTSLGAFNMSSSGCPQLTYGTRGSYGVSWDNTAGTAYIYSGGFKKDLDISAEDIVYLDRINVDGRNGGTQLDGDIKYFDVGSKYITPTEMEARMSSALSRRVIGGAGQSLEKYALDSEEDGSQSGYDALIGGLNTYNASREYVYIGTAEGGSSVFKQNNSSSEYWWDEDTDTAGTMLTRMYNTFDEFGVTPTDISWSQGEQDALFLNKSGRQTEAQYKAKLQLVFEDMREKYPNVKIWVKIIGTRADGGNTNDGGTQSVRNAQLELIEELSYVYFGAEQYHATLEDNLHFDNAGNADVFGNQAKSMASQTGDFVENPTGPEMTTVIRSGAVITIDTDSTSIPNSSTVEGFAYFDNSGSEVSITSAVVNDNQITINLSSDSNGTLYYPYDRLDSINRSNVIKDGDDMPLRSKTVKGL